MTAFSPTPTSFIVLGIVGFILFIGVWVFAFSVAKHKENQMTPEELDAASPLGIKPSQMVAAAFVVSTIYSTNQWSKQDKIRHEKMIALREAQSEQQHSDPFGSSGRY